MDVFDPRHVGGPILVRVSGTEEYVEGWLVSVTPGRGLMVYDCVLEIYAQDEDEEGESDDDQYDAARFNVTLAFLEPYVICPGMQLEGDSEVVSEQIRAIRRNDARVLVRLGSRATLQDVLAKAEAYADPICAGYAEVGGLKTRQRYYAR